MSIIYLDLGMGAAGDMLAAALYELLGDDSKRSFIEKMNSLGLKDITVSAEECIKCGIKGTHMNVRFKGEDVDDGNFGHDHHGHDHEHDHDHHHHHGSMDEITHVIGSLPVSDNIKSNVTKIYDIIAGAESTVHGAAVSAVHFHEVGMMDAVADVTAVSLLMEMLAPEKVVASPLCTGFGKVRCAHGILPVPAPATAGILSGIPAYAGDIEGELCTPTGAALVKYYTDEFSVMPCMKIDRIGYGMGKNDFEAANCVRAILGDSLSKPETVTVLSCNVDDMTGEAVGYATAGLLEEGALDVYTVPIGMKKSRPGTMINVMCREADREKFVSLLFKHTSTLGVRENICGRYTLKRTTECLDTSFGQVRAKYSEGYGIKKKKYEYDDVCRIASQKGISFDEAVRALDDET